jgi:hypothetical protein
MRWTSLDRALIGNAGSWDVMAEVADQFVCAFEGTRRRPDTGTVWLSLFNTVKQLVIVGTEFFYCRVRNGCVHDDSST